MSPKPLALAIAFGSALAVAAALPRTAAAGGLAEPYDEDSGQAAQTETSEPGAAQAPSLSAKIVAPGAPGGARDAAKIQVKVTGVESPLLQYKVDQGPAFETSDTTIRLRGLKPGQHKVSILLESPDGAPLGPSESLDVDVP